MREVEDVLIKMDPDKRLNLINSAMKEFGANRFDKASTNTIVKEAGISKGLLYHYFVSKDALYEYLREYTMETIGSAILSGVDWQEGDIINRLYKIASIKIGIFEVYPYMTSFSKVMYEGKSMDEIKALVMTYMPNIYTRMYTENIDYTLFKEGIDPMKAVKMIELFLDGLSEEKLAQMNGNLFEMDINEYMKELSVYLDMYKKAFYKEA